MVAGVEEEERCACHADNQRRLQMVQETDNQAGDDEQSGPPRQVSYKSRDRCRQRIGKMEQMQPGKPR